MLSSSCRMSVLSMSKNKEIFSNSSSLSMLMLLASPPPEFCRQHPAILLDYFNNFLFLFLLLDASYFYVRLGALRFINHFFRLSYMRIEYSFVCFSRETFRQVFQFYCISTQSTDGQNHGEE